MVSTYSNVITSNTFIINLATTTRDPIEWTTIGDTDGIPSAISTTTITNKVRKLRIINTVTIYTIIITTTIINITIITFIITIATINHKTGKTSVIIKIVSDTGEVVSEFKSGIRARADGATSIQIIHFIIITIISIPQTIIIQIRIINANNIPLNKIALAE